MPTPSIRAHLHSWDFSPTLKKLSPKAAPFFRPSSFLNSLSLQGGQLKVIKTNFTRLFWLVGLPST